MCSICEGGFATPQDALAHPLLGVSVCAQCHDEYCEDMRDGGLVMHPDEDGYDSLCCWCRRSSGDSNALLCCFSCKLTVCESCITFNLGHATLAAALADDEWQCVHCAPQAIALLRSMQQDAQRQPATLEDGSAVVVAQSEVEALTSQYVQASLANEMLAAQLEDEPLATLRADVTTELALTGYAGEELERAVASELETYTTSITARLDAMADQLASLEDRIPHRYHEELWQQLDQAAATSHTTPAMKDAGRLYVVESESARAARRSADAELDAKRPTRVHRGVVQPVGAEGYCPAHPEVYETDQILDIVGLTLPAAADIDELTDLSDDPAEEAMETGPFAQPSARQLQAQAKRNLAAEDALLASVPGRVRLRTAKDRQAAQARRRQRRLAADQAAHQAVAPSICKPALPRTLFKLPPLTHTTSPAPAALGSEPLGLGQQAQRLPSAIAVEESSSLSPPSSSSGKRTGKEAARGTAEHNDCLDGLSSASSESEPEAAQEHAEGSPARKRVCASVCRSGGALALQRAESARLRLLQYRQRPREAKAVGCDAVVNVSRRAGEPPAYIEHSLSQALKPHQREGIRFLWNAVAETSSDPAASASGCVLAHSMGMGKTLQVIAFWHTLVHHTTLKKRFRTMLIVAPVSTLHGWGAEFHKWWPSSSLPPRVHVLDERKGKRCGATGRRCSPYWSQHMTELCVQITTLALAR